MSLLEPFREHYKKLVFFNIRSKIAYIQGKYTYVHVDIKTPIWQIALS